MGIETAIIGSALIGGGMSLFGASQQADAAEAAASEQARVAREQMKIERQFRQQAIGFAAPTSKEWAMYNQRLQQYEKSYAMAQGILEQQKKQIISTYGDAIVEQGKQLLQSMQGQESAVEKTFSSSRQRQRQKLEQQLIDRLGPGALTSSAGTQALNQFDQQTSDQLAGLKDQALNSMVARLGGIQQGQSSSLSGLVSLNSNLAQMSQGLQGTLDQFQVRRANAAAGAASGAAQMAPLAVNTAGSQFVGEGIMGGAIGQLGSQLGQVGGQLAGYGMMSNIFGGVGAGGGGVAGDFTMGDLSGSSLLTPPAMPGSQFGQPITSGPTLGEFNFGG